MLFLIKQQICDAMAPVFARDIFNLNSCKIWQNMINMATEHNKKK